MNDIKPIAETAETVTLNRSDWTALLEQLEDAQDMAAVTSRRAHEARVGKEAARRNYLSSGEVRRLLDGESPVAIWREKRGLSQRALAEAAGVSPSYLAEIELGRKPGSAEALSCLATALRVPMAELIRIRSADLESDIWWGQLFIRLEGLVEDSPNSAAEEAAQLISGALHETTRPGKSGGSSGMISELGNRLSARAEEYARANDSVRKQVVLDILERIRSIKE
jgi:transcriptional regulator with XRE-family HTH domain